MEVDEEDEMDIDDDVFTNTTSSCPDPNPPMGTPPRRQHSLSNAFSPSQKRSSFNKSIRRSGSFGLSKYLNVNVGETSVQAPIPMNCHSLMVLPSRIMPITTATHANTPSPPANFMHPFEKFMRECYDNVQQLRNAYLEIREGEGNQVVGGFYTHLLVLQRCKTIDMMLKQPNHECMKQVYEYVDDEKKRGVQITRISLVAVSNGSSTNIGAISVFNSLLYKASFDHMDDANLQARVDEYCTALFELAIYLGFDELLSYLIKRMVLLVNERHVVSFIHLCNAHIETHVELEKLATACVQLLKSMDFSHQFSNHGINQTYTILSQLQNPYLCSRFIQTMLIDLIVSPDTACSFAQRQKLLEQLHKILRVCEGNTEDAVMTDVQRFDKIIRQFQPFTRLTLPSERASPYRGFSAIVCLSEIQEAALTSPQNSTFIVKQSDFRVPYRSDIGGCLTITQNRPRDQPRVELTLEFSHVNAPSCITSGPLVDIESMESYVIGRHITTECEGKRKRCPSDGSTIRTGHYLQDLLRTPRKNLLYSSRLDDYFFTIVIYMKFASPK